MEGALWFSESANNAPGARIGRIITGGAITEMTVSGYADLVGGLGPMTFDASGNLWFAELGNSVTYLDRYAP